MCRFYEIMISLHVKEKMKFTFVLNRYWIHIYLHFGPKAHLTLNLSESGLNQIAIPQTISWMQ